MATKQQVGEHEGIHELHEAIFNLFFRNAINVEHRMESPTDEEIIQGIMDTRANNHHDPDDSCALLNISPKEAF